MKRLWRRLRTPILLAGSVSLVAVLLAGWWAADRIASRFEARERETTSRLMGRAYPLVAGTPGSPDEMRQRLAELGYRQVSGALDKPGTYAVRGERFQIHLRSFQDPSGEHPSAVVRVRFGDGEIRDVDRGGSALEPATIALFHGDEMEERDLVALSGVPKHLVDAILAAEDRRFYVHPGVDPAGILRALWANITSGSIREGGSTLTQQLAKNLYFSGEKSFSRKGAEAFAAMVLETKYSKERILQAYLNEIYLGQHGPSSVRGVASAARHYYGTDVSNLDLAQSALLAGMIRAPGRYDPFMHPKAARERRRTVLRLMQEAGSITEAERYAAEETPLPTRRPDACDLNAHAAYVAEMLEQDLIATHGPEFRAQNLRIHTTIDPLYQAAAEKAVKEGLAQLEKQHPRLRRKNGEPLQAALVSVDLGNGGIVAMVGGRGFATSQFNRATSARRQPGSLFKPIVYLAGMQRPEGSDEDRHSPQRDEYDDRDVVRGPAGERAPRISLADFRAPGSDRAVAPARRKWRWFWQKPDPEEEEEEDALPGEMPSLPLTAATILMDSPYEVQAGKKTWAPRNYDNAFRGPVTVQRALEESLNVPTARAAAAIGLEKIVAEGHTLGIDSDLPEVPSLALGTADVTPLEMATVFATIASGGKKRRLFVLRGVENGTDVLHPSGPDGSAAKHAVEPASRPPAPEQAIPRRDAYLMTALLEGVVENGTGKSVRALGFDGTAAGKTGTSDGGRDLWFCAFTPRILTLVWVGFDDNTPTHQTGASAALPIWVSYMDAIGAETHTTFEGDHTLLWAAIDPETGQLARRSCPVARWAPFVTGTEPTERCRTHRSVFGWWDD